MPAKMYVYKKCSTCQNALKFLDSKRVKYEEIPIVEKPPTVSELKQMLKILEKEGGTIKNLFNTSGIQYRELKIAEKMKDGMSESEALNLLSKNGKLIKRPFLLAGNKGLVGFKEDLWKKFISSQ